MHLKLRTGRWQLLLSRICGIVFATSRFSAVFDLDHICAQEAHITILPIVRKVKLEPAD
jgi:hypothetical protein